MGLFNRTLKQRGLLLVGGLIASGVVSGGIFLNTLSSSGGETSGTFPAFLPAIADAAGSGSTSLSYDSMCISSPLVTGGLSLGSGTVIRVKYDNIKNPLGIGGDLGFVKSCNDTSASGSDIIDNVCTATGCTSYYTTGTITWNGTDKLKLTLRSDPTTSFDAKITMWLEDNLGE